MLRRVAALCRPLRPVLLLASFPRSRGLVVGVLGLCCMWRDVPFARQQRPIVGVLGFSNPPGVETPDFPGMRRIASWCPGPSDHEGHGRGIPRRVAHGSCCARAWGRRDLCASTPGVCGSRARCAVCSSGCVCPQPYGKAQASVRACRSQLRIRPMTAPGSPQRPPDPTHAFDNCHHHRPTNLLRPSHHFNDHPRDHQFARRPFCWCPLWEHLLCGQHIWHRAKNGCATTSNVPQPGFFFWRILDTNGNCAKCCRGPNSGCC